MTKRKAKNPVRTSQATFEVLEGLETLRGASLTELATYLGKPKSTVHNHLSTLLENQYVVKEDGTYNLGLRFTELGEQSKRRHRVYTVGKDEVNKLAAKTGELANLATEEHGKTVYLYRACGEDSISTDTFAGKRVHSHSTSLGKAMLAFMPEPRVHEILDHYGMPAETEHTITDREEFLDELDQVRENGFALDKEERGHGIRCVAVPVLHQESKRPVGAVSVSAPVNRMQEPRFTGTIPELIRSTVNVIEIELLYSTLDE